MYYTKHAFNKNYIETYSPYKARRRNFTPVVDKKPLIYCGILLAIALTIQPLFDTAIYSNIIIALS